MSQLKGRYILAVFAISIIIGLLDGIWVNISIIIMESYINSFDDISTYQNILGVLRHWIVPVLLLLVSYAYGKKVNIREDLRKTVLILYMVCFTGFFIGDFHGYFYAHNLMGNSEAAAFALIWGFINSLGSGTTLFFTCFSALTMRNMLNNPTTTPLDISNLSSDPRDNI